MSSKLSIINISILVFFSTVLYSSEVDTIYSFKIELSEAHGCVSYINYFNSFSFENGKFQIVYGDKDSFKVQTFDKEEFVKFYDTLLYYDYNSLESIYKNKKKSTASILSTIVFSRNKRHRTIYYWTYPDDSTNFMFLYECLKNRAQSISSFINLQMILETKFYNHERIYDNAVLNAIKSNIQNFNPDDIITIIDTTSVMRLKYTLLESLKYFKDDRIIEIVGNEIISIMNDTVTFRYNNTRSRLINVFAEQSLSELKIRYLKQFLRANDPFYIREASRQLTEYGVKDAYEIFLNELQNIYKNPKYFYPPTKEFFAILKSDDVLLFEKLIEKYNLLKSNMSELCEGDIKILKHFILLINLKLDNNKDLSEDEYFAKVKVLEQLEKEIVLLDSRLSISIK